MTLNHYSSVEVCRDGRYSSLVVRHSNELRDSSYDLDDATISPAGTIRRRVLSDKSPVFPNPLKATFSASESEQRPRAITDAKIRRRFVCDRDNRNT